MDSRTEVKCRFRFTAMENPCDIAPIKKEKIKEKKREGKRPKGPKRGKERREDLFASAKS